MLSIDPLNSFSNLAVNTLRPKQNGRHIADDICKCILLNENIWITIKNSLKFVPKGPINNIPALVQIMAWRCPGDKPLSEPMLVNLAKHICVTRPQWVNRRILRHLKDYFVRTLTQMKTGIKGQISAIRCHCQKKLKSKWFSPWNVHLIAEMMYDCGFFCYVFIKHQW